MQLSSHTSRGKWGKEKGADLIERVPWRKGGEEYAS